MGSKPVINSVAVHRPYLALRAPDKLFVDELLERTETLHQVRCGDGVQDLERCENDVELVRVFLFAFHWKLILKMFFLIGLLEKILKLLSSPARR
jgi:hypothetical protein